MKTVCSLPAVTFVWSDRVSADAIVAEVLVQGALVEVVGTGLARPTTRATAVKAVGPIDAGGAVLAGVGEALVDLDRTVVTGEALRATTLIAGNLLKNKL